MKNVLVFAATTLLAVASFAEGDGPMPAPINTVTYSTTDAYSPNFTCADLRAFVAAAGRPVAIQMPFGFGVYASTRAACGGMTGGGVVTGTTDKRFCNVGFVCVTDAGGGEGGGGSGSN